MHLSFNRIQLEVHQLGYTPAISSWYMPPHRHQQYEIHFVTKGRGITQVGSQQLRLLPDMVYMAPPGEEHEQFSDENNPMELFHVLVSINGLAGGLPRVLEVCPSTVKEELSNILLLQRYSGTRDLFAVQVRILHLVWSVISPVMEREGVFNVWPKPAFGDEEDLPQDIIKKTVQYIVSHKMENPTVQEIARHCHISSRQLSRLFSQKMNTTLHEFIQQERLLWARNELLTTSKPIEKISENLNFNSKQYFCHWFKKYCSISPAVYRQENLKNIS